MGINEIPKSLHQSARQAWATSIARRTPAEGQIIQTLCAARLFRYDSAADLWKGEG